MFVRFRCWVQFLAACIVLGCGSSEPNQIALFEGEAASTIGACAPGVLCAPPTPYCYGSQCVACLTHSNCGNRFCDAASHTCVECVTSGDCKNDKPYCSASRCRQCLVSENCGDPMLACDTRAGKCVSACQTDAECPSAESVCLTEQAICVTCLADADCPTGRPRCQANACVACTSSEDCDPMKPVCDEEKFECIECLTDGDCAADQSCDMKKCR